MDGSARAPGDGYAEDFWRLFAERLRAICLFGILMIPALFVLDWIVWRYHSSDMPLAAAIGVRLGTSAYYLLVWLLLRSRGFGPRGLTVLEWAMVPLAGVVGTALGMVGQGIDTVYFCGAVLVILARGLYLPGNVARAVATSLGIWATYPLTILVGALFSPSLAAQLADPARLSGFVVNNIFLASVTVLSCVGTWLINRLQLQEFRLQRIGRYRVIRKLDEGGMGIVYLARHGTLKRLCALKLIGTGRETTDSARVRFIREARATSSLDHPNTIQLFDFGELEDGRLFYAMEYLHGMDLGDVVTSHGVVTPGRAIHFVAQICRSVEQAHVRGIVHRDLKPSNCFAIGDGSEPDFVKVLDFGLAKVLTAPPDQWAVSAVGHIVGTPSYMAPEQVTGKPVDGRTDVYAIGCVLAFLLTGRPLFTGSSQVAVLAKHATDDPEPPSRHNPAVPSDLDAIVMKCVRKDPNDRFASAAELHDALLVCESAGSWTRDDRLTWWQDAGVCLADPETGHRRGEATEVYESGSTLAAADSGDPSSGPVSGLEPTLTFVPRDSAP